MVTPVTPAGEVDEPAVGRIVDHLIANGIGGIFPLGTTGESPSVPTAEQLRLIAATVKHVNRRAMVYAGISSNCFRDSVEAAVAYGDIGAEAAVAHVPTYYTLSDDDIESYFLRLADTV